MAKVETLDWRAFMAGKIEPKTAPQPRNTNVRHVVRAASIGVLAGAVAFPTVKSYAEEPVAVAAFATSGGGFVELFAKALFISDWLAAAVFFFAGITWMFGNRTKGIELLLSGSSGYLITRHALEIRDWLKTI